MFVASDCIPNGAKQSRLYFLTPMAGGYFSPSFPDFYSEVENWFSVIIRCTGFLGSRESFALDPIGPSTPQNVGGIIR